MAERYQRCFTLPVNLYAPGAPVLIAAGALLLDTQTNSVLAQLKLQNIGAKPIKSVKVAVSPLDPAGRALGEPVPYQYLDLSVARDGMFGQKYPIRLPDASARSFTAAVTEVIFSDNTIWSADAAAAWAPLAEPIPLTDAFGDTELVKQYQLRHGADAAVLPVRIGDLWRCACGALNREEEAACHACGKAKAALLDMDISALEREKNERLEAERKAREAKEAAEREAAEKRKAAAEAAAKKTKKILAIAIPILVAVIAAALIVTKVVIPNSNYNKAVALMDAGKTDEAILAFQELNGFKDSYEKLAELLVQQDRVAEAAIAYYKGGNREQSFALWDSVAQRQTIAAGYFYAFAIQSNGNVLSCGDIKDDMRDAAAWSDVIAVSANLNQVVGLRADGTVATTSGGTRYGLNASSGWTDIVAVAAGSFSIVGLRADGTVVAVGENSDGKCDVSGWSNIIAIAASDTHTVGLRVDGTVVAAGDNEYGQCDVSSWTDIVAIAADFDHTVGLRADGTVVAVGDNEHGQCDVSGWRNIVAIAASEYITVGLRADGTVVAAGKDNGKCDVAGWRNIVAVTADYLHIIGLCADGTVIVSGDDVGIDSAYTQSDVDGWTDIKLPNR